MTYEEAQRNYRTVGAAHVSGDALRAMCADIVASAQGGAAVIYFAWLQAQPAATDTEITQAVKPLLRDRATAWDVLMTQQQATS